uniref:Uncharacterized protein n=2 Tax=Entomoneis paludosa TaxID=265537 RepID=A0A7S3DRU9_9STRA|mmetsp:Transcript_32232/g.67175  ORF Transcript_32232/g.67175 Transcript_32232/m.67175 type:complete len:333 (+) Transcript_32232:98-1096(+)
MIALSRTSTTLQRRQTNGSVVPDKGASDGWQQSPAFSLASNHFGPGAPNGRNDEPSTRRVLACSAVVGRGRSLCADRRGAFDHLAPTQLVKGIVRVTVQQGATIFSSYMSDQLKEDMARDEKVQNGEMTSREADEEAAEWSEREWAKRFEVLPTKLITAYMKYHATTLIMRLYEHLASRNVSTSELDKLTLDPFSSAKRRQKQGETPTFMESTRESWNANLIAYLADYSLHQIILAAGYYVYVRDRQRKMHTNRDSNSEDSELHTGSLALSFMKKSTLLGISRFVCLSFASIGGGIGNIFYPGWGYMFGFNMGDGFGATVLDEFDLNDTPLQ